jgi:hypothetical protein
MNAHRKFRANSVCLLHRKENVGSVGRSGPAEVPTRANRGCIICRPPSSRFPAMGNSPPAPQNRPCAHCVPPSRTRRGRRRKRAASPRMPRPFPSAARSESAVSGCPKSAPNSGSRVGRGVGKCGTPGAGEFLSPMTPSPLKSSSAEPIPVIPSGLDRSLAFIPRASGPENGIGLPRRHGWSGYRAGPPSRRWSAKL